MSDISIFFLVEGREGMCVGLGKVSLTTTLLYKSYTFPFSLSFFIVYNSFIYLFIPIETTFKNGSVLS